MRGQVFNGGAALDRLVDALHARGRLRVWSLIITIFGDAIVPRGGKAGLSVLQEIMTRLNIENGALRTAMSRLAADGWVVREKSGRNSIYALAASGRHAFDEATRRIYASGPPNWDGCWVVAVGLPGHTTPAESMSSAGFVKTAGETWLRPETEASPALPAGLDNMLVLHANGLSVPKGVEGFWQVGDIATSYHSLAEQLAPLAASDSRISDLLPLDAMAVRSLVIHDWRRTVLRDPCLPAQLLPADWPGEAARAMVRSIYTRLAPASEQWLDDMGLAPLIDPTHFAGRFGIFQSSR